MTFLGVSDKKNYNRPSWHTISDQRQMRLSDRGGLKWCFSLQGVIKMNEWYFIYLFLIKWKGKFEFPNAVKWNACIMVIVSNDSIQVF